MDNQNQYDAVFHEDAGHGWLQVPIQDLIKYGISNEVSNYSYMDTSGHSAYLEEDCDAGLFLNALKAAGITLNVTTKHYDYQAPWRSVTDYRYDDYRAPVGN